MNITARNGSAEYWAIEKARSMVGKGIVYKLGAGGRNPKNPTPETYRDGVKGCDCAGFVAWAWGFDRLADGSKGSGTGHPGVFPYWGGWVNTDSMLADAFDNNRDWFSAITHPRPGCFVVYASRGTGKTKRIGHVGIVTEVPDNFEYSNYKSWEEMRVIDCRSAKPAIMERSGVAWYGKDRQKRDKQSSFVWPELRTKGQVTYTVGNSVIGTAKKW